MAIVWAVRGEWCWPGGVTQMDFETVFLKLCPAEDDLATRRRQQT